jgi:hypothetical protein
MPPRRRLSLGEALAAIAAAALLLSTVLPWFQQKSSGGLTGTGDGLERTLNAWQAFIVLAIAILLVAAVPLWQVTRRLRTDVPPSPQLLLAAGALALTLVLAGGSMKLGDRGGTGADAIRVSTTPEAGFVVAVMAALVIAAGAVVAMWHSPPRVSGS